MFEFAYPWLFLCLALPWLVKYILPAAKSGQQAGLKVPFYAAIQPIVQSTNDSAINNYKNWLCIFAWILLVIAAAGPRWLGEPQALPRTGRNIMLDLDISGSMNTPDLTLHGSSTNRLNVVKYVAAQFIKARAGDRIGLILFGSNAYLQTPLTFDRATVLTMLSDASIGLAGQQTAIGDAIALAVKRLDKVPEKNRILILLTDGANNAGVIEPLQAAEYAKKAHIKIYTIGLGANRLIVQSLFGPTIQNPSIGLDTTTLQKIAKITGGKFFRAENTRALQQIYSSINRLEPTAAKAAIYRPVTDYYYWPIGIALLLSFYLALTYLPLSLGSITTSADSSAPNRREAAI